VHTGAGVRGGVKEALRGSAGIRAYNIEKEEVAEGTGGGSCPEKREREGLEKLGPLDRISFREEAASQQELCTRGEGYCREKASSFVRAA